MKKYVLVILVLLVNLLTACAVRANTKPSEPQTEVSISFEETNELETNTTEKESVKETTQSTSKKQEKSTSKKAATEKVQTTKSQTTTKAVTTTEKKQESTTKKQTPPQTTKATTQPTTKAATTKPKTTKPATCTNNSNHSLSCGNIGRWFASRSDVKVFANAEMQKWANLVESGAISYDEYFQNCPSGYECWSCSYCGRWTGNFTY